MAGFINLFKFELNYLNTIVFRLLPLTLFSQLSIVSQLASKIFENGFPVFGLGLVHLYSRQALAQQWSRLFGFKMSSAINLALVQPEEKP